MSDHSVSNYGIFDNAVSTTTNVGTEVSNAQTTLQEAQSKLSDESIFMGPIQQDCVQNLTAAGTKISAHIENFKTISSYLQTASSSYKSTDDKAASNIKDKAKNVNTTGIQNGSNVANAVVKYKDELNKADYATVDKNLFSTTTTETINGQPVKVTHVVINNGSQINGAPANGNYGSGLETASSAAKRLNSSLLINGSHFDGNGTEDLKGANNIVIVNGQIKKDGTSGGNELLLDSNGNIFNAYGKTAQELVDSGVKYSFACHSTQVIENGDTSPSYREPNQYKRNVIGQAAPGEYYIITDTNYNNRLSDTAEYLKSLGVQNAYSLDQGGSVTLVRDDDVVNNPSGEGANGERPVGDFLYFTV